MEQVIARPEVEMVWVGGGEGTEGLGMMHGARARHGRRINRTPRLRANDNRPPYEAQVDGLIAEARDREKSKEEPGGG